MRLLQQYVPQTVLFLFVILFLLLAHVAIDSFFGERRQLRRYFAFAAAENKGSNELLQPGFHETVPLLDGSDEPLLENAFFSE